MIKTVRYCDKCKKEFIRLNYLQVQSYAAVSDDFKVSFNPTKFYDLCENCTDKLKKWIDDND